VIVEGLQASLVDKIDRNIAEIIVQKKYEDIVQYLQDALEASSEDEDNFKNVALELEEKIKKLASSKSDRIEIQPLQESLVKAEASIAKLTSQHREVGKSDEVYSKSEVNVLLDLKVDKENLEELVNLVIKSRRGKRMVPGAGGGGGGLGSLLEEMNKGTHGHQEGEDHDGAAAGGAEDLVHGGREHRGSGVLTNRSERKSLGGFPSSSPGVFRAPTEGGRPGGYSEKVGASVTGAGLGKGSSSVYNNSSFRGVPSGLFPPANGAIALSRSANDLQISTAAGAGGTRRAISSSEEDRGEEGYSPTRSLSPERQSSRDEYAFLGAATKGGGFNTRQQQAGRPPVINALSVASRTLPQSPEKEG
jgi:hypothetical protein